MKAAEVDIQTRQAIRNASDERASAAGFRFDEEKGVYVVDWIERYCKLYEGEFAGQPLKLLEWQRDIILRLFGWVRYSEKWGREVRRFRRAGVWVPKKNGKSPLLAAVGLYMLCGDGEQGQKIYSVAKDGKQAMIAHTHALEMVRRSPELKDECSVNKTTGQITHEPSRSFYRVVAGDNPNSQEGLNGSVMVDETHVVDARLMRILRGAGISRSEPLQLEVSTAGKNPDGYGKQQRDDGKRVESGEITDHQFFFAEFAASQDVTDEQLDAETLEIGKAANPSWGHTIDPEEFVAEYRSSKRTMAALADFKMYRLNVWQQASNPWIPMHDWRACQQDYSEDEMENEPCWIGLDLSKTRDMTAAVAVFPWETGCRILPHFWLPRQVAQANEHVANFAEWERDGWLTLTDGDVIDYSEIEQHIVAWSRKFAVRKVLFDQRFAEELTQRLELQHAVMREAFRQGPQGIGPSAEDFERMILEHTLWHNGNPVMTWQVGHVEVKTDATSKLKLPVKPDNHMSIRKIDGVIACVMGLAGCLKEKDSVSWYVPGGLAL